jgi:hypothetical protein
MRLRVVSRESYFVQLRPDRIGDRVARQFERLGDPLSATHADDSGRDPRVAQREAEAWRRHNLSPQPDRVGSDSPGKTAGSSHSNVTVFGSHVNFSSISSWQVRLSARCS